MARYIQRPENALKRANGELKVGEACHEEVFLLISVKF